MVGPKTKGLSEKIPGNKYSEGEEEKQDGEKELEETALNGET